MDKLAKIKRIDNLTSYEVDYELKQLGWYSSYKNYSITAKKEKLKDRVRNFF